VERGPGRVTWRTARGFGEPALGWQPGLRWSCTRLRTGRSPCWSAGRTIWKEEIAAGQLRRRDRRELSSARVIAEMLAGLLGRV
jgi:hypothetical protein